MTKRLNRLFLYQNMATAFMKKNNKFQNFNLYGRYYQECAIFDEKYQTLE